MSCERRWYEEFGIIVVQVDQSIKPLMAMFGRGWIWSLVIVVIIAQDTFNEGVNW